METINQIIDYIKHNKKNTAIIILSLIIFLTSCFFIYKINEKPKIKIVEKKIIKKIKIKEEKKLIVDIKGEVKNPGVYEVKKNTRINDQTTPIMIQRLSHLFARKPLIYGDI